MFINIEKIVILHWKISGNLLLSNNCLNALWHVYYLSILLSGKRNRVMINTTEWQTLIPRPIEGPDDAVAMIEKLGFCTWGPIPRLNFPNLADAMGETAL